MMKGLTALGVDMKLAEKAKKRNFILALAFTIGLIAGIPCIVVGATNMGDNKGFVALLVFGIVGTVLGFYGSPLMWTRLATVNQELTARPQREPRPRPHAVHPRLLPLRRNGGTHQRRHRPLPLLRQRPLRPRQTLTRTTHLTCTNHHFNTQNARFNRAFTDDISRGISRGQYIIIKGLK